MITRREVLQSAAMAAGSAALAAERPLAAERGWFDKPMRWAQLNSTEDDAAEMDIPFWLDYFRRIHADALCITAGGVVAFYPTNIKYHHPSRWLSRRPDYLRQVIEGCRKPGMAVVARTDPHATYEDVYRDHPDWIAVDAEGRKRRHWEMPDMWVTCALGPYNFEFMTEVTQEIVATFPEVGGIFSNRWEGSGMCYCEHCAPQLPGLLRDGPAAQQRSARPARRNYIVWREKRLFELWRLVGRRNQQDQSCRKIHRELRRGQRRPGYARGRRACAHSVRRPAGAQRRDGALGERQERQGIPLDPWQQADRRDLPHGRCLAVPLARFRPEPNETRIWVLDGVANGLRPWFNKVGASVHDHRWLKVVEDLYVWHWKNERYLRNEEPVARVALVYSQQTTTWYGGPRARQKVEDFSLGMYHALIEARMPFEMLHDGTLDTAGRFKLLLLPNIAALSEKQCEQIRRFVEGGGSVLATYETSLYDENGERRRGFRAGGPIRRLLAQDAGRPHPELLLAGGRETRRPSRAEGLEDAELLINGTYQVEVEPAAQFGPPLLTAIPQYPSLPMEKNMWRVKKTDRPGIFLRQFGKGRVVYFPWDIDRVYWEVMVDDHGRLLRNAIDWALDEERPVTRDRPGRVGRDRVEAEEFDDGPPGEPDEPDDDAAQLPRDDSVAAAAGPASGFRRASACPRCSFWSPERRLQPGSRMASWPLPSRPLAITR